MHIFPGEMGHIGCFPPNMKNGLLSEAEYSAWMTGGMDFSQPNFLPCGEKQPVQSE